MKKEEFEKELGKIKIKSKINMIIDCILIVFIFIRTIVVFRSIHYSLLIGYFILLVYLLFSVYLHKSNISNLDSIKNNKKGINKLKEVKLRRVNKKILNKTVIILLSLIAIVLLVLNATQTLDSTDKGLDLYIFLYKFLTTIIAVFIFIEAVLIFINIVQKYDIKRNK